MARLSLCMIVRDEENCLGACLESVLPAVDEIVIVDTGSTDGTKEIARRYTDRVYDFAWCDDFAAARNASLAYAKMPFILWLDADDVIDADQLERLIALKEELDDSVDAVMMPYHYAFAPCGRPSLVFDRERIVRRAAGFCFAGAVHEAMAVSGRVIRAEIAIRHTGEHGAQSGRRNLAIFERQIAGGRALSPRELYYYAQELKNAGETERAERMFARCIAADGWIEERLDACLRRGECLQALGRTQQAREAVLAAFALAPPRAQALCTLGQWAMEEDDLRAAVFWYGAALLCGEQRTEGFSCPLAHGYIPLMQMAVCLDRMGMAQQAASMNEQALLLCPGDEAALSNRAYFARVLGRAGEEKTGMEG